MATLFLYNTVNRRKEKFRPLKSKTVGVYSCGPTVYHDVHIGNFRSFLFSDFLHRVLRYNGFRVKLVMNITDVGHLTSDADTGEDKVEKSAATEGISAWDIARRYEREFERERALLNILPPFQQPRATDHIAEQIALIKKLERKGFTYRIADGIYFDTAKFKKYGALSRQKLADKKGGARVSLSDEKRQPSDFALWKFSSPKVKRQMEWPSPWGVGFPGWHIECSAMSAKYLGQPFDIHTGGVDHLAVHHEDEIAQSVAATGKKLARFWMHGEFLVVREKGAQVKMSKSLGHDYTVTWLQSQGIDPLAYRYLCLTTHYRKPLEFTLDGVRAAETALNRLREAVQELGGAQRLGDKAVEKKFLQDINDDLNFPRAMAVVWNLVRSKKIKAAQAKRSLLRFDEVLGLGLNQAAARRAVKIPASVETLLRERKRARQRKDWAKSDELRDSILKAGFRVEDTPEGQRLEKG